MAADFCTIVDASVESAEATTAATLRLEQLQASSDDREQLLASAVSACEAEFRAAFLDPAISGSAFGGGAGEGSNDTALLTVQRTLGATFGRGGAAPANASSSAGGDGSNAAATEISGDGAAAFSSQKRTFLLGVQVCLQLEI